MHAKQQSDAFRYDMDAGDSASDPQSGRPSGGGHCAQLGPHALAGGDQSLCPELGPEAVPAHLQHSLPLRHDVSVLLQGQT